jgi:CubicO group peptidase (beta-lactamase class C family)
MRATTTIVACLSRPRVGSTVLQYKHRGTLEDVTRPGRGILVLLAVGLLCPVLGSCDMRSTTKRTFPGVTWEFRAPEEVGLDGAKLDNFVNNVGGLGAIVKDGYMVKTWGPQPMKETWGSASKPVISTMLFFAVNEGRLSSVDDLVSDWGWELDPKDRAMSFRHLANNVSGYTLAEPPGKAWAYNDFAINLFLKTIYTRVFTDAGGINAADSATRHPKRLGALHFQDGPIYMPWTDGGWEVNASVRDYLRIGWFWLNKGNWNGRQLLPRSLFEAYLKPGVSADLPRAKKVGRGEDYDYLGVGTNGGGNNDTALGPGVYGFNWWHNAGQWFWPDAPIDTFQANGHWNKEVLTIMPSLGIVAAWRSNKGDDSDNFNVPMNDRLKILVSAVRDTAPPSIPKNVVAQEISVSTVRLSWTASTDDVGIAGYRVYRDGRKIGVTLNTSYTDAGLSPSTTYTYAVSALDGVSHEGSKAKTVRITTLPIGRPIPGQIVVDPNNPAWLKYSDGRSFFLCGPGDPENFLYRGSLNPNGTRTGDQMSLINKLKDTGANSIYFEAIRSHGGDGDKTHDPFINNEPAQGINMKVLDQWETWFTEMDNNNIVIYFIFYDDGINVNKNLGWPLDNLGNLHPQEKQFLETLVKKFKHHRHLIWNVMEEVEEMGDDYAAHATKIAETIRRADDHDHVIAVHKLSGLDFSAFADDANINQFAIQYGNVSAPEFHQAMIAAWRAAAGRYNLNMSEGPGGRGATIRKKLWAIAMGGAYCMVLYDELDGIRETPLDELQDQGRLVRFFESTNVNEMAPHDELHFAGTEYVLANPGKSYIAYASNLSGEIGLRDMSTGTYDFAWFDIKNGTSVRQIGVRVAAGNQIWASPAGIGQELVVYIRRQ